MSSGKRYTEEFKIEAVKQVTERGYSVAEVAERLGTTTHSLYAWIKRYGEQSPQQISMADSPRQRTPGLKLSYVASRRNVIF